MDFSGALALRESRLAVHLAFWSLLPREVILELIRYLPLPRLFVVRVAGIGRHRRIYYQEHPFRSVVTFIAANARSRLPAMQGISLVEDNPSVDLWYALAGPGRFDDEDAMSATSEISSLDFGSTTSSIEAENGFFLPART